MTGFDSRRPDQNVKHPVRGVLHFGRLKPLCPFFIFREDLTALRMRAYLLAILQTIAVDRASNIVLYPQY